ncbi:hypothetical protein JZ751_001610 [Albula glossodonta]|uniref:Uncharacterized protein n=1 Tax=Albula glossodonta TaxID=121402 RepID=A0A8T2PTY6_9TELE|nr:hypothetical protein JZ751_001610 [Albula glossodonta]
MSSVGGSIHTNHAHCRDTLCPVGSMPAVQQTPEPFSARPLKALPLNLLQLLYRQQLHGYPHSPTDLCSKSNTVLREPHGCHPMNVSGPHTSCCCSNWVRFHPKTRETWR